jgi:hypothetical protein
MSTKMLVKKSLKRRKSKEIGVQGKGEKGNAEKQVAPIGE